jgi:hypothetical protein
MHVTTGVRNEIGMTRIIGLDRTNSIKLKQDGINTGTSVGQVGFLSSRNENKTRKNTGQDGSQNRR